MIGKVIKGLLKFEQDDDVRTYTALTAARFLHMQGVVDELERVILDVRENPEVRWNALGSIEQLGATERARNILLRTIEDRELGKAASRIMKSWE